MQAEASSFGEKVFEAPCRVTIPPQAEVDAIAEVWTLGLAVKPNTGTTVFLPYTDATKLDTSNFRATLATASSSMTLSRFGTKYDQFAREVARNYSDAIARALLMTEPTVVYEASGTCSYTLGGSPVSSPCRARVYDTALVILPENARPKRFPFSSVTSVDVQGYRVNVSAAGGGVELSRLGNATQFFADKLREAMRNAEAATIETIKAVIPSASYEDLRRLSWPMLEGRAAPRKAVEAISPDLWKKLELSVANSPLADAYQYLSSMGESGLSSIGLRKTMEQVYVWFLIPVMGSTQTGGNAVALEVTSEAGHATYLFRVMDRAKFPSSTKEEFAQEAATVSIDLNEAIIATGFRREPIYLTEDQLNTLQYGKYLYAAANLEPLRFLRERFFGRIIHTDLEQWKQDLRDALLFNSTTNDPLSRWAKSAEDFVEFAGAQQAAPVPVSPTATLSPPTATPSLQTLNEEAPPIGVVSERVLIMRNMEADDRGNVKIWLHDAELDHDTAILITGDQASKLGAFPGSKIKVTLQKT